MPEPYVDEQLTCVECSSEFTFTADEQQRHADLGYENKPKRCHPCRAAKKQRHAPARGQGPSGPREFHTGTCATCGGEARVPFKPRGDKPIYCSACFKPSR